MCTVFFEKLKDEFDDVGRFDLDLIHGFIREVIRISIKDINHKLASLIKLLLAVLSTLCL